MNAIESRLLNEFQCDFPLCNRPFVIISERLGASEQLVLERLRRFCEQGIVSRVGAVFAPFAIGASTLAALSVPQARLQEVAAKVSAHPEVNHNYEREHRYNLWFVAAAADHAALDDALREIECEAQCGPILSLPLIREYRIDLGFDLSGTELPRQRPSPVRRAAPATLTPKQRRLIGALQAGLPLTPRPYAAIAAEAGLLEQEVVGMLEGWIAEGTVRRFGVIVRHRELGYCANAMAVWDVVDAQADTIGARLAHQPDVTLCYRRARALPEWRYNLFCMVHGRSRDTVLRRLAELEEECGLADYPATVLFSRQRFKQRGARYVQPEQPSHV